MATDSRGPNPRGKLLRRFYEPLILLYALNRNQGTHIRRVSQERGPLHEISDQELRRRFLDSISYVCDSEKGGDTTTATAIGMTPLTYYIACNKNPSEKVVPFLQSLLSKLSASYDKQGSILRITKHDLLEDCVNFSRKRLQEYRASLEFYLKKCLETVTGDDSVRKVLSDIQGGLTEKGTSLIELCLWCDDLMKSNTLDPIRQIIRSGERNGNEQNSLPNMRHYVGRLAYHVNVIKVLVESVKRLPSLFDEPEIVVVSVPEVPVLPRPSRRKSDLKGIANRIVSNDAAKLADIDTRLEELARKYNLEEMVQTEFASKNFKPRVHAELILVDYIHRNHDNIDLAGNEAFVGCSKPACYCCSLYIREHPGNFIQPASHQKIYLNWMPPTSVPGVEKLGSELALHERDMINKVVQHIRKRTIDEIMSHSGRRPRQFDSTTGDNFSDRASLQWLRQQQQMSTLHPSSNRRVLPDVNAVSNQPSRRPNPTWRQQVQQESPNNLDDIASQFENSLSLKEKYEGSDDASSVAGGVLLEQ